MTYVNLTDDQFGQLKRFITSRREEFGKMPAGPDSTPEYEALVALETAFVPDYAVDSRLTNANDRAARLQSLVDEIVEAARSQDMDEVEEILRRAGYLKEPVTVYICVEVNLDAEGNVNGATVSDNPPFDYEADRSQGVYLDDSGRWAEGGDDYSEQAEEARSYVERRI